MTLTVRDPTPEEREALMAGAAAGCAEVNGTQYRIDYSVATESMVKQDRMTKTRRERITASSAADVIFFVNEVRVEVDAGETAVMADPLVASPQPKKPCTFFNKGTCRTGVVCPFGHSYVKPRPPRAF